MPAGSTNSSVDALWAEHAAAVRRRLLKHGVTPTDLDDVVQEVFMVAHDLGDELAKVQHPEAWLSEVSRRVAAGYRRRAHRRREVAYGEPPEIADASDADAQLADHQDVERLHHALGRLDEKSRDLVALRELGSLPLTEVAALVKADRKTVSKRLSVALRKLTNFMRSDGDFAASGPASGVRPSTRPSVPPAEPATFRPLAQHRDVRIALIGTVVIALWPGPPTLEALQLIDENLLHAAVMCGSKVGYLAVVESTTKPPTLEARQRITQIIKAQGTNVYVYATAIEGGAAWIVQPIITALSLLARPPYPTHFFQGVANAARWLADHWRVESGVTAHDVCRAVDRLRADT